MSKFSINKWAAGAAVMSVATMVIYLLMPLFGIPLFGISTGCDYIKLLYEIESYVNLCSFLLPFIGGAGVLATVFIKDRAPHILSIAFALLPVMFFAYVLIMISAMFNTAYGAVPAGSFLGLIGSGLWAGLAASLFALVFVIVLVVADFRKFRRESR